MMDSFADHTNPY